MNSLTLNSFPAEIHPSILFLPYAEYGSWEASTEGKNKHFSQYRTYRYRLPVASAGGERIRIVLISGPSPSTEMPSDKIDVGNPHRLGANLIEDSLGSYLESRGMKIKRGHFERIALRRVDASSDQKIHIYSGISFTATRPFREQGHSFAVSVQWVARAVFSETLASPDLQAIARGLSVIYTPREPPLVDLAPLENRYIGHVTEIIPPDHAEVICRDDVRRRVPLRDLTLEARPEAIRDYERATGSRQQSSRIWKRLQQVSKVLTNEGRRNPSVLRDRLDAIRNIMASSSKEQLVLPVKSYAEATVSIGLSPIKVELAT